MIDGIYTFNIVASPLYDIKVYTLNYEVTIVERCDSEQLLTDPTTITKEFIYNKAYPAAELTIDLTTIFTSDRIEANCGSITYSLVRDTSSNTLTNT